jgi:hypothetical protein
MFFHANEAGIPSYEGPSDANLASRIAMKFGPRPVLAVIWGVAIVALIILLFWLNVPPEFEIK